MPSRGGKRTWEPTTLTETKGERESREWIEAQKEIADLKHKLDVAERTAKAAANLLLRKPR
jgi:tellurite resistance protein